MEIIYGDASNQNLVASKRLLRVVQGQTQATPTSGYLDPSLRSTLGGIRIPTKEDKKGKVTPAPEAAATFPFTRSETAFTLEGSLTPGLVLVKTSGENYAIADGNAKEGGKGVFGLLGQWVGGTLDGVKNTNAISAWQGPDSQYDILAPGFNSEELATEVKKNEQGEPVPLYAGPDGRLTAKIPNEVQTIIAYVVEYTTSVLRVRLVI